MFRQHTNTYEYLISFFFLYSSSFSTTTRRRPGSKKTDLCFELLKLASHLVHNFLTTSSLPSCTKLAHSHHIITALLQHECR